LISDPHKTHKYIVLAERRNFSAKPIGALCNYWPVIL